MENKIYNEDCASFDIKKHNFQVDVIFTSPPYNLGKGGQFLRTSNPKTTYGGPKYHKDINLDKKENYSNWLKEIILKYLPYCEYFFLNLQSLSPNKIDIIDLIYQLKDYYIDKIIWDKGFGVPTGFQKNLLMPCFEEIFIFSKYGNKTRKINSKPFNSGSIKNIIKITKRKNEFKEFNQAVFPLELCDFIIKNFVPVNGKIADIFSGTGSCAISALNHNVGFIGIEINKQIFDLSIKRIQNYKKNK